MKKILKGIITLSIVTSIIFLMIPFNIHADQNGALSQVLTDPFIGINIQVTGFDQNQTSMTFPTLNIDSSSVNQASAYIVGQLNCTNPSTPTSSAPCDVFSFQNSGGNSSTGTQIKLNLQNYFLKFNGNASINYNAFYEINYEFILNDSYVGYVEFVDGSTTFRRYVNGNKFDFQRLLSDQTEHTITITNYELYRNPSGTWAFPIESYPWINHLVVRQGLKMTDWNQYLHYYIPTFKLVNGNKLYEGWVFKDEYYYMSFFANSSFTFANVANTFDFGDFELLEINTLNVYWSFVQYTLKLKPNNNGNTTINILRDVTILPLYFGYNTNILSTDFALMIGVNNTELANLDLLANGNAASNQSASDLQQGTNTMQDKMDDMVDIESGYNQQFNNSLNNIDFTNPIQSNAGILPAANFVITVFNGLVNNPLSILIIIICILTIGKKVIGK